MKLAPPAAVVIIVVVVVVYLLLSAREEKRSRSTRGDVGVPWQLVIKFRCLPFPTDFAKPRGTEGRGDTVFRVSWGERGGYWGKRPEKGEKDGEGKGSQC